MMKRQLLWIAVFFLKTFPAFSQASSANEPFVTFSPQAAREIFGVSNPKKRRLDCPVLLAQEWAYSNAQVVSFCNDAQTSCVRLALIEKNLKKQNPLNQKNLEKDHLLAIDDVKLKLRGCQLAIESTITGSSSVLEGSGLSTY